MKFYVYILESEKNRRLYIGQTENITERLNKHNKGHVPATRNIRPLKLLYAHPVNSRSEAMFLEKKLKSWKSRKRVLKFIDQHIEN